MPKHFLFLFYQYCGMVHDKQYFKYTVTKLRQLVVYVLFTLLGGGGGGERA